MQQALSRLNAEERKAVIRYLDDQGTKDMGLDALGPGGVEGLDGAQGGHGQLLIYVVPIQAHSTDQ